MRFLAHFTPIVKIVMYVMAVISLVGMIVGILALTKAAPIELSNTQATLLVSVCPMCVVIALVFTTVHYKVDTTHLRLYVGFIDVLGGRVRIDKILNIVIENKVMYISYLYQGMDPIIAAIVINPKRHKQMKELLISKNPNILFFENKDATDNSEQ